MANNTSVPAATLAAHSHVTSHSRPTWGAYKPRPATATSRRIPVIRAVKTKARTHLVRSVCHLFIGTGRRWRDHGPVSVVAYARAASTELLTMVPPRKPENRVRSAT